ncbi:hypothetical protein L1887_39233 [Cichorium endivia]|nr:hypothetical protein L1887_39233 [Cichorium endivia]
MHSKIVSLVYLRVALSEKNPGSYNLLDKRHLISIKDTSFHENLDTMKGSRTVANRLSTRKDNDIILLPYNPKKHWVLAVLDMKTTTCYYLDSLRPSNVNPHLRQIIDAAMVLYVAQSGSNKRVKLMGQCYVSPSAGRY